MEDMRAFIAAATIILVGCSGAVPTAAESSAGGAPPGPDYVGGGGWYNPCGRTYKLAIPLPDGGQRIKEVTVYCTIWDGDFVDPPPDEMREFNQEEVILPPAQEQMIK